METYIVYDPVTLRIIKTFKAWGTEINHYLNNNPPLKWINKTHPNSKDLFDLLNAINNN